jgi:sirohydrochlorin ferrochelatase
MQEAIPSLVKRKKSRSSTKAQELGSHAAMMRAIQAHVADITSSPEKSVAFLKRAGLLTPSGKVKHLIRG